MQLQAWHIHLEYILKSFCLSVALVPCCRWYLRQGHGVVATLHFVGGTWVDLGWSLNWLNLFQSSTILFVNQSRPISLLNLHYSSLSPLFLVLSWLLIVRTFPTSALLKPFTHLNTSIKSPLTLRLSSECNLNEVSVCVYR